MTVRPGDARAERILRGFDKVPSRRRLHQMIRSAYHVAETQATRDELAVYAIYGPFELAGMRQACRRAIEAMGDD
jgi:hypothetical protein